MRLSIRAQLGSLLLLSSLIGLAVISIAVWITTHSFVLDVRASRLALVASLKAAQLVSNLDVMQTAASFVSTRVLIQRALMRYNNNGNNTDENWSSSVSDLVAAIGSKYSVGQELLLQTRIYPRSPTGPNGPYPVLNATATGSENIALPYRHTNGSVVHLGDNDNTTGSGSWGYPPNLYPNLTYASENVNGVSTVRAQLEDRTLNQSAAYLLGPWRVNETYALVSLTMCIVNNTNPDDILGYLTVLMDSQLISDVMDSREGLDNTGDTLLLGPATKNNLYKTSLNISVDIAREKPDLEVRYILPVNDSFAGRHPGRTTDSNNPTFQASSFPTIYDALARAARNTTDVMGANLRAKNEAGKQISVGYAFAQTSLVNWMVLVEQTRDEVWQPIDTLRKVIIGCLFATAGLMAVIAFPLAHFASMPIRRLRQATARSIEPSAANSQFSGDSLDILRDGAADSDDLEHENDDEAALARKEGFVQSFKKWKLKREGTTLSTREERKRRAFRIPGKVKERKWWIKDELTDLTSTFNEMSDELMMQYTKLEDRVQQRTAELETSKKAAEAANESKTLFIANISHELKTPLNGILGMCAVCMQEDDPLRLKRSLGIIYKSGDLLLNLLTDLLTFSKNQVGQALSLDEKEFRLRDVQSQVLAIFDKQAKDGKIDFRVEYEGIEHTAENISSERRSATGPADTGRMRDMVLWGDIHRILQVVINLVSNSLKFTPAGGAVVLVIRALPDVPEAPYRRTSNNSRQSKRPSMRQPRSSETSSTTVDRMGTANAIYSKGKHGAFMSVSERGSSPPPGQYVYFEFEVEDTGPGIPDHLQSKIFEPFVQGDLGLSKKYGGTGLGLSICSQLASLMKGSMRVRSHVGLGSTFTMKIPLLHIRTRVDSSASSAVERSESVGRSSLEEADRRNGQTVQHGRVDYDPDAPGSEEPAKTASPSKTGDVSNNANPRLVGLSQPFFASNQPLESPESQPAAMEKMTAEATRGGRIRVLVAEDNKVNQEVVLRMLKLEDIYDVRIAKDGQEALDLVKESMRGGNQPFNLIFMDVQMPNVDGLQSTRLIREIGYQAPIVALTAFAEESNIKDCLDSGMNYFLSKPIRRPQLKKVLKDYCTPIPEESEDSSTLPEDERRSSNVSTTIVVMNNQNDTIQATSPQRVAGHMLDPHAGPTAAVPTLTDISSEIERPISPKTNE